MELNTAAEMLIKLITDATFLPFAVGFTVAATALVKNLPVVRDHLTGGTIAVTFQVAVWIAWIIAKKAGVEGVQFESLIDGLTTILSGIAGLVTATYGAHVIYTKAAARNVPLIGKPRSVKTWTTSGAATSKAA